MLKLNLPEFDFKIRKADGKIWIFDRIRKKYIILTPEEWVRQHFVNLLITHMKYPQSLVRIESGLVYNQLRKRSDIVVYSREGNPWMIVECKAPDQSLTDQTIKQVAAYNNTLKANYILITNGLKHLCYHIDWIENRTTSLGAIPAYV